MEKQLNDLTGAHTNESWQAISTMLDPYDSKIIKEYMKPKAKQNYLPKHFSFKLDLAIRVELLN